MKDMPITFEHNGKKYSGYFAAVHGAGQNVWHLMDNKNFYLGQLRFVNDKWVFNGTTKKSGIK
jgi:hypothetical protein